MTYREAQELVEYGVWFYRPKDQQLVAKFGWPTRPCFCSVKDSPWDVKQLWETGCRKGVPLSAPLWARLGEYGFLTISCLNDEFELQLYRVPASWLMPFSRDVPWVVRGRPGGRWRVWLARVGCGLRRPWYRLWCRLSGLWWRVKLGGL